jgi:RHS repeat-associated protein
VTLLERNAAGELVAVTRPDGSIVTSAYWPDGALKTQTDAAGAGTSYGYDTKSRLASVTDPAGRTSVLGYDPGGRLTTRQQPGGSCVAPVTGCISYGYNTAGELTSVDYSDPATHDVSFGYDSLGRRTSMTDADGVSSWVWDQIGRLVSHTDPVAGTVGYGYNDAGAEPTSVTYPGGKTVARTHDQAGRLATSADWASGTTTFGYDEDANLTSVDTPASSGVEDTFVYDAAGRLDASTLRQGTSVLATLGYTRDPEGMVTAMTGTGVPAAVDAFGYTPLDQLASDTDGGYQFDLADNLVGFPDGRRQRFSAANELCYQAPTNTAPCEASPVGATTLEYDSRGNRTARRPPGGVPTTVGYDQEGRLTSARVPALEGAEGQYHALTPARVLATGVPTGLCVPSPCARLQPWAPVAVQITGQGGVPTSGVRSVTLAVHVSGPDADGWFEVYPSGSPVPAGRAATLFNAGQDTSGTVVVQPGSDGRIMLAASTGTHASIEVLGWHADEDTPTGGLTYEPLAPARILKTTSPSIGTCTAAPCARLSPGSTTTVAVTGQGGVPTQGVTAVAVVAHVVNPAGFGFLTAWPTGSARPAAAQMVYETTISNLLVVPVGPGGTMDLYSFNATDVSLDVVGWYGPATTGDGLVAHPVAPALALDTRNGTGTCEPSPCARLAAGAAATVQLGGSGGIPAGADAVAVMVHAFDPAGAGWLVTGAAGQPLPSTAAMTYATAGSLISGAAVVPVDELGRISMWSSTSVDISIQTLGWYDQASQQWSYTYSGEGLRRTKTAPDGTTTTFTWDRSRGLPLLLAETVDAPGTAQDRTVRYVHDPAGRILTDITEQAGVDTVRWYHHDQLGSVRALTDGAGAVIGTYSYSPFGEPTDTTGSAATPFGWAGEYRDAETGFVYLRARYYDPATAQFLTRDPLSAVSRDPYGYGWNNPVNVTDPSGMIPPLVGAFVVGTLIGGGLDLGFQALGNVANGCGALSDIDWGNVAQSGLIGGGLSAGSAWMASGRAWAMLRGINWADDTGAIGRANSAWGRILGDFRSNPGSWTQVSAHAEPATSLARRYAGATSLEEVFVRGGDRVVRHRVVNAAGEILHETFRPLAKFGL